MVVLVPDVATRDAVRALAVSHPVEGLHASVVLTHDELDVAVRDTRRSLFQGPLAVLAPNDASALRALAAGADEAFSLTELKLDYRCWKRLIERAELKCELRQEAAQRLASLSELEKLCALGRLVSGFADELTGPLHGAQVALEALKRELEPLYAGIAQLREHSDRGEVPSSAQLRSIAALSHGAQAPVRAQEVLAEVGVTCEAISQVARDLGLRELGVADERPEFVDLRDTLDGILRLFSRGAAKAAHIERDYCAELPELMVPRGRIAQALISLVSNALANLRGAPVQRLRIQLRADDAVVTVTVSDNGQGRAAHSLDHFFEPGASEANAAGGLELAAARNVMRSLGGDLLVESLRGSGSTFVAWLPRPKQHELRPSGTVRKPEIAAARERRRSVLVVEPDRGVLGALSHLLRERYDVLLAQTGQEARALLADGTRPDAILAACDDTDSRNFVEWVLTTHADLTRRLLITSDLDTSDDTLLGLPWLEKPLEPAALVRAIEARFVAPLRKTGGSSPRLPRVAKG